MAARPTILLATRNPGKAREIISLLEGLPVRLTHLTAEDPAGTIPSPVEDGATFAENARHKALYYARRTGLWALADDSGLQVDALGGAPGVRSARYALDDCPPDATGERIDRANNTRLLRELAGLGPEHRNARFVCHLALADGRAIILEARGVVQGRIAERPAGRNGFGYDPIFFLPEQGCTAAELSADQKNRISHRGRAVRALAQDLKRLLASLSSAGED